MKFRIIFQQEVPGNPTLTFVDIVDENGNSISIGEWSADGEYEALDIDTDNLDIRVSDNSKKED